MNGARGETARGTYWLIFWKSALELCVESGALTAIRESSFANSLMHTKTIYIVYRFFAA
jgi:hypothetical protein